MPSLRITAIDSQPIGGGYLTHQTELLDFKVGLFHRERLAFYVTSSPTNPVILGFPWLQQHDPQISWHKGELVRWSATCLSKCLHEPVSRPCLSLVQEVFSRERAAHLLAHRAWGCTIDLLPNTSPPKGQVYPLSLPEARAIEEYIEDALAVGHIRPSTSPAAAGFFFMGKKDRGLRPCIDYRGLNSLINEVFQDILGNWVIAYIDDILVYSTSLEEHPRGQPGKPRRLSWSDQAQAAFVKLKDSFTTAPILRHPDPDLPFVVEVDASSSGIWAVMSQQHGVPGKLHPCAFFSRKLTATKANYDVRNRELLSIKAALEKWQHWLEGARHPFLVLTDHCNLEYIHSTKHLNQARWALFFTRFEFSVTYRPGTKNSKADALSRQFEAHSEPSQPDLILPAATILAPVQWSLIEEIQQAHANEPPPANCPSTKVYVPLQFHQQVLQWVHEAPSSGHSGILRSTQLTLRRFWWPSLRTDVERFVRSCSTCAQSRVSRQLPEGLLEPLPTPQCLWSHLSVDFLTDLPNSGGFTTVMVVVDRFSKACKLIPLKGSPTAMQTAEAMFQNVFWNFGLPEDVVSDQRSQFTSRVWRSLCERLSINVSLSSGYHTQSNGQAECLDQEIGRFLRSYCSREQQCWRLSGDRVSRLIGVAARTPPIGWDRGSGCPPRNLKLKLRCRKLSPKFIGPFEIVRQVNPVCYRLRLPASYHICPTFHVSLLKPAPLPRHRGFGPR
ncbi:hypothetical protein QTP86_022882 [Hemibagrus guttatus]|nr:hypothetical protein QTP86_022882 [Hemibagrus guttatus]